MQINGMRQRDVDHLQAEIKKLKEENPFLSEKVFSDSEDMKVSNRLAALEMKVDEILTMLRNIFGDAVLINGKFQDLKLPK